jgi:hypothetical protein
MSTLEIYVAEECWSCEEARRIAGAVGRAFPNVQVHLKDLNNGSRPSEVFAAPTYLLDGRIVSLGNPSREELWAMLAHNEDRVEQNTTNSY